MSILFEPGSIGTMDVKNRFVRSATAECLASDGSRITDRYVKVYTQLAKGGVGLIITGNYYVHPSGRAVPRIIVLDNDDVIDDLRQVTGIVHEHGAKIVAQLNHGGRQSDPKVLGRQPIGPSSVRDTLSMVKPREMSQAEITEMITAFGDAAFRAKEAGFDGVQIHAAHGYLVNQFLSGHTNRRSDEWGGSPDNRMRFLLEIYDLIRSRVGADYPVLVKINSEDSIAKGVRLEECIAVCMKLDELGIDAIEVSGGIAERGLATIRGDIPADLMMRNRNLFERAMMRLFLLKALRKWAHFEEGYFLPHATAVKRHVNVPVIAVGGIRRRTMMEKALQNANADFISLSRPFIRQPNLVNLIEKDGDDVITCVNCNRCTVEVVVHYNPLKCYYTDAPPEN